MLYTKTHELEENEKSLAENSFENKSTEKHFDNKSIEKLQECGISIQDIIKLKQSGICTLKGVLMAPKRLLSKIKGLSDIKIDKMKDLASKHLNTDFMSASSYAIKRQNVYRISTGSTDLDTLLGGGIQTNSITEAFGEFRTGKTQLASTLCVTVQLPESEGGCNGKAAFIDTEGTFRPDRLKTIAIQHNLDPDTVLENVIFARAYNSEHQFDLLQHLTSKFSEDPKFKLLIVDSIISLFRVDFSGRGELNERQQKLNQYLSKLLNISEEFNVAVFITNQMMADPSGSMSFVSDPKKPIGGHVLAHASTTRLYLRKGRGDTRVAKVYDSPDLSENEAVYCITDGGICNVEGD
ncbi:meiotic recombination protein dmc1 lim15-like protein [Vairimorpha apis BRL 01]|uniref:Meiotic recombination protein dmc1 lim15-like protein n=1 Tax=Vairimorpha apis BRL 01 TaxID=1037528 RepID=T0MI26_9MICR|nr:meiotic recombination protein dmc1 lim15-like protein [Vairimorpha apis BRL 01]